MLEYHFYDWIKLEILYCGRFPVGNADYVKLFLLQYSLLRRKEGFVLRHDSLASGGLGINMSPEQIMGANVGCLPKHMGHMVLPDVLCTSGSSFFV